MEQVDEDETKLYEVYKHSFGIVVVYIQTALGMVLATGLAYFLLPSVIADTERAFLIGSIFAALSVLLAFIVIVLATIVYKQSRLIVTDRNITQVLQYGLFNRKVSQLNMMNVEDVTSTQNGFIATMMNFGTLKIETAGEQSNFNFTYCPNSNYCAKLILDAREKMLGQMDSDRITPRNKKAMKATKKPKPQIRVTESPAINAKVSSKKERVPYSAKKVKNIGAEAVGQTLSK